MHACTPPLGATATQGSPSSALTVLCQTKAAHGYALMTLCRHSGELPTVQGPAGPLQMQGPWPTLPKHRVIDTGLPVSSCAGGLATLSASSRMPSSGTLRKTHLFPSRTLTTSTLWYLQRQ